MVAVIQNGNLDGNHPALLQLNHYCDACTAARATHRVWVDRYRMTDDGPKSLDLVLCSHHLAKHRDAIDAEGYEVEEL